MLVCRNPTQVRLVGFESRRKWLEDALQYHDKKVDFELRKLKNSYWYAQKFGAEAYKEKLDELKQARYKSLLFEDAEGLWTYSGLAQMLAVAANDKVVVEYKLPEPKLIPWAHAPEHQDRPYQVEAMEKLLAAAPSGPAAVEIGTGLGKSFIILKLLKRLGLKTLIMAPSLNIAKQLYRDFVHAFGTRYVGAFYDGKKQPKKLFVVGVAQSLTRIAEGSTTWEDLSSSQVFIADESHLCPATTLAGICFGLAKAAPYRFFFSGTQMRNDGLDMVLDGITGPVVFRMTVREGVDKGYLARPVFKMVKVASRNKFDSIDVNKMTRAHLYYNDDVVKVAADITNKSVRLLNRPVLILIEEFEQFTKLLPYLRGDVRFAHGGVSAENKDKIPEAYWESDPSKLVDQFNDGQFPILIGTSCISTGTDIKAVKTCVYLQGGKSEIQIKQAVGRVTRLAAGKTDCIFVDFDVENVEAMDRHAGARREIYDDIYGPVEHINYAA